MNFEFDLNALLPHEITKFNSDLRIIHPSYLAPDDPSKYQLNRDMKQKIAYMIDKIGEASSRVQGLRDIITTFRKFNLNDQHRIYLMKDSEANSGKGSLVGLLKVGEKRLFVHDIQGQTHEMMPLCVLDFYVYDNQQRKGYGLRLFNEMLVMENVKPEHLAIDSPSEKSMRFLKKHYNLKNPINQVNNFVVFHGFFENRQSLIKKNARKFDSFSAKQTRNEFPPIESRNLIRSDSIDSKINNNPRIESYPNSRNSSLINLNYQPMTSYPQVNQQQVQQNNQTKIFSSKSANINENNRNNYNNDVNIKREQQAPTPNSFKGDLVNENNANKISQVKYNSFYDSQFSQNHKYDPFPSLNPFNNRTNTNNQNKPPLPPPPQTIPHIQPIQNNKNEQTINITNQQNMYNPFPSLNAYKANTNTDLYTNQYYMNSKFRRTKLW